MEKIYIASDHAAYDAKMELVKYLKESFKDQYQVQDMGTHSIESVHYPELAMALCKNVQSMKAKGILLCGTGIGMSMVANRYRHIRAALCRTVDEAKLSKEHNNANVLCLGGRVSSKKAIEEITKAWLETTFEGGRHSKRIGMFDDLGEK